MDRIYTITCIEKIEEDKGWPVFGTSKFIGYYFNKDEALEDVEANNCDINEFLFRFAVIEEIEPGLYSLPRKRWVFEFDDKSRTYHPIDEPKAMRHIANVL